MSQEPEDVKPKLNLNISFDGQRTSLYPLSTFLICVAWNADSSFVVPEITVKVKTNMKFSKIFEAAEVC
jgi:hypothetical protein